MKSADSPPDLAAWTRHLAAADLPVDRETAERIAVLAKNADDVSPRDIALVVLQDPLMTAKLLASLAKHRRRRQVTDILSVEGTIVMMGVMPFFREFGTLATTDQRLAAIPAAADGLRRVIERANNAADWAASWAARRNDLEAGEVMLAALLHDLTEMLTWCFAPRRMLEVERMQAADPALRSRDAQEKVLGVALNDLHVALVREWHLPELLVTMMDDSAAANVRVRNVKLAVDLARHSANGWDDAALPDDYRAIGQLLHMTPADVRTLVEPAAWST